MKRSTSGRWMHAICRQGHACKHATGGSSRTRRQCVCGRAGTRTSSARLMPLEYPTTSWRSPGARGHSKNSMRHTHGGEVSRPARHRLADVPCARSLFPSATASGMMWCSTNKSHDRAGFGYMERAMARTADTNDVNDLPRFERWRGEAGNVAVLDGMGGGVGVGGCSTRRASTHRTPLQPVSAYVLISALRIATQWRGVDGARKTSQCEHCACRHDGRRSTGGTWRPGGYRVLDPCRASFS